MQRGNDRRYVLLIYAALALATTIAYEPIRHNDFVNYDDDRYVTENTQVQEGITRESVIWAFTGTHQYMWHPLTSLSHMVDCELFGLNSFWHHLVSFLIHVANVLLLFWILKRMTGAIWCSAFVAAAFGLHPLMVESVAWVAERKNVLSSLFWILTIAAYVRYAERPGPGRYLLVVLTFCMALMAKPVVVTLPFVLLLLDYWPLGRFRWARQNQPEDVPEAESARITYQALGTWRLIAEKIPLFILSAIVSVITYVVQQSGAVVASIEALSLNVRISNALVSYVSYIGKVLYPAGLALLYPHPGRNLPPWQPISCLVILVTASAGIIYVARRRHYLAVGWLWYLGILVPVIGLVQSGEQAMADRYTYLPSIGIYILVAWEADELVSKWRLGKIVPAVAACTVLATWLVCTRVQIGYWQNSLTLWEHSLAVTEYNRTMHHNYGCALLEEGRLDKAVFQFRKVLETDPKNAGAHAHLGITLMRQGKAEDAIKYFHEALRARPDWVDMRHGLGEAYAAQGKYDLAVQNFNEALRLDPTWGSTRKQLAAALAQQGDIEKAVAHYRSLGHLYSLKGEVREAFFCWEGALELKPESVDLINNLAWMKATHKNPDFRNPEEAIRLAQRGCELTEYGRATLMDTLAAAYAAAGRFPEATETAGKAVGLAKTEGKEDLAEEIKSRLRLYERGEAYREE